MSNSGLKHGDRILKEDRQRVQLVIDYDGDRDKQFCDFVLAICKDGDILRTGTIGATGEEDIIGLVVSMYTRTIPSFVDELSPQGKDKLKELLGDKKFLWDFKNLSARTEVDFGTVHNEE